MPHRKIYSVISAIMGVIFLYDLYLNFRTLSIVSLDTMDRGYYINLLFTVLGAVGLGIFIGSGFSKSGLLRFFLCKVVAGFIPLTLYMITAFERMDFGSLNLQAYLAIFGEIMFFIAGCAGLWLLVRQRKPVLQYTHDETATVAEFAPVNAGIRFLNYIADYVVIFFSWYQLTTIFRMMSYTNRDLVPSFMYSPSLIYLAVTLWFIIYYLLLEGIFNTSAGKSLTNTIIVNEYGKRPGFLRILGRTLCRLIPFEAFSFFSAGARGWHDTITNTFVIDSTDTDMDEEETKMVEEFLNRDNDNIIPAD